MDDYSLLCPICIEPFRSPILIKECGHNFCEQCLFTYVTTLKDKGELGSTFPCPLCRQDVTSPSATDVTLSWIQTFPVDEKLIETLQSVQAEEECGKESSVILCEPCTTEDEQNRAVKYCVNCHEYLCKDCVGGHKRYKQFRDHSMSDISAIMSTNKVKELVDIRCKRHPDKQVDIYCQRDNIYCCLTCATVRHRECAGLKEIAEMEAVAIKRITNLKQKFKIAEKHIDGLLSLQKKSIPELLRHKENITDGLKRMKHQIVSAIDDIIDNFNTQIKQQVIGFNGESGANLVEINALKLKCQKNRETIETLTEYGLPAQKVISQINITKEYYELEKKITDEENTIEELVFSFGGLEILEGIHKEIVKCKQEQVHIVRNAPDFMKYEEVVSTAGNRSVVRTEKHSISLLSDCTPTFTGITVVDDKHLLLCDNCAYNIDCGHVCLYDIESKAITKLKMNKPFSAAVLKNKPSHIAVSVPKDKEIHILSIKGDKLTSKKTFKCAKSPYSLISLENGLVGVTLDSPPLHGLTRRESRQVKVSLHCQSSFDIVDMSGYEMKTVKSFTQDLTGRKFKSFEYVAVDELRSHIVQSCHKDYTVYCFDYSGNPVFEYKDLELKSPHGVDIDRDGNIYICSGGNHTLHVLTPSGRKIKVMKDVPNIPQTICFDETGERFWLTQYTSPYIEVFLFSLVE